MSVESLIHPPYTSHAPGAMNPEAAAFDMAAEQGFVAMDVDQGPEPLVVLGKRARSVDADNDEMVVRKKVAAESVRVGLEELFKKAQNGRSTAALKYTVDVVDGNSKAGDEKHVRFFGDLLKVLETMDTKKSRQIGTQGFQWNKSPLMMELSHTINMISPAAYEALKTFMPLPEARTLKRQQARRPKFPVDIRPRTFTMAKDHLASLNYNGPTALCVDDSELEAAIRPWYDEDREAWCALGAAGDPMILADPRSISRGHQVRPYRSSVKAKAITDKLDVDELFGISWTILCGLLEEGIMVCSYACDGTTTERDVQHRLDLKTDHYTTSFTPFTTLAPLMAILQDDLHLLKTIRNNAYSGARLLVFPNSVVMFSQIRDIALQKGPLYQRDVLKLDRQDDNAAARLFSAATLEWLTDSTCVNMDNIGLIVYLFVFGELVDAFQNRRILHIERVRMVLRAYFFLDLWERFLNVANYPTHKYFLSRESVDAIRIIIKGFFQILLIHRDHLPQRFALFLNLLGTALYRHGVDLAALSVFPSDLEITEASKLAWSDASDLFTLLGASPSELDGSSTRLPPISQWYAPETTRASNCTPDRSDSDEESESEEDDVPGAEEVDVELSLQQMLAMTEDLELESLKDRRSLMKHRFAAIALELHQEQELQQLSAEVDETALDEALSDQIECIGEMLACDLPPASYEADLRAALQPISMLEFAPLAAKASLNLAFQAIVNASRRKKAADGAGMGRIARYTKGAKGGEDEGGDLAAGNALNAKKAALLTKRNNLFKGFPRLPGVLGNARVNELSPIRVDTTSSGYGFGLLGFSATDKSDKSRIVLCHVRALYEKEGSKTARHNAVDFSTNICALSYIDVQVFEQWTGNLFRGTHERLPMALKFAKLPPRFFMCTLDTPPANLNGTLG
ncbi:hypothetical protein B0H14DRAFT_3712239 [Mycena olivaceomarginata]|nr:hypothetical protein B0H14DRAFT_3712239 [Mycena olivaceomarginata]